jgi:hypothetical protein
MPAKSVASTGIYEEIRASLTRILLFCKGFLLFPAGWPVFRPELGTMLNMVFSLFPGVK